MEKRRLNQKYIKLKDLNKNELTIFIYIFNNGISKARTMSYALDIDLHYLYKILTTLSEKGFITKINNNKNQGDEYITNEGIL